MGLSEDIEFLRYQLDQKLSFEEDSLAVALIVQGYLGGDIGCVETDKGKHWYNKRGPVDLDLCAYKLGQPLYNDGRTISLADISSTDKLDASLIYLEVLDDIEKPKDQEWDATLRTKRIKERANNKRILFTLTQERIEEELSKHSHCPVCDCKYVRKQQHPNYPTIDRLLPSIGYTEVNIIVMCRRCNNKKVTPLPQKNCAKRTNGR